ncbi:MAG: hypothetical protein WC879_11205 [Melioribacteraceae bacterium]
MKIKLLNQKKQFFLLAVYLYLVTAGLFHHHSYSFKNEENTFISLQNKSEAVNDFLDNTAGICSLEHFLQSINFVDYSEAGKKIKLPEVEQLIVKSSIFAPLKVFYYSYPLRAPPAI